MKLIELSCPNCGAQLKVGEGEKQAYCQYCRTTVMIDDEVQHVQYDNAEEAGYKFEKGRQRAQEEAFRERMNNNQSVSTNKEPEKRKIIFGCGCWGGYAFSLFLLQFYLLETRK